MSFKATLFIFDKQYPLIDAKHSLKQHVDISGRPTSRVLGGKLELQFVPTSDDTALLEAMISPYQMVKGYIRVYKRDGMSKDFDIEFANAFVILLTYTFNAENSESFIMETHISPQIQRSRDTIFELSANPSNPFTKEEVPVTEREVVQTAISRIAWINTDDQEEDITEISYTQKVSLIAEIQNPEGGTATITIEKEDGSEFENGKKQLSFTESVTEEGTVEISPLEIKAQWEEFKTADIDKLIAKVAYNGASKKSAALQIVPPPKVIVDFRPSKNYDGEYGFDYMRDKAEKKDLLTYKDILGTNKTVKNTTTGKKTNKFTKYTTDTKFNDLKDTHYKTLKFSWYKDAKGNEIEYLQSWLAIFPKQKATLGLQLETIENTKKIDLTLEYDKTLFKLSTDIIPGQSKGKKRLKDHIEIECLKEFSTGQTIKVMHDKRQLGQLNILPNDCENRYKTDVVFVEIETDLRGKGKSIKGSSLGKQSLLEKYLKQALIKPTIVVEPLDLTIDKTFNSKFAGKGKGYVDNRTGLHTYLNKKMNAKYKDYLKVYFIPDKCPSSIDKYGKILSRINGQAMAIGSDAVVVFDGHNKSTTTHEALHALGIRHTFDKKATYGYKKGETYNIMDYSHQSQYGSKKRIITWLWQWKTLWKNTLVIKE